MIKGKVVGLRSANMAKGLHSNVVVRDALTGKIKRIESPSGVILRKNGGKKR